MVDEHGIESVNRVDPAVGIAEDEVGSGVARSAEPDAACPPRFEVFARVNGGIEDVDHPLGTDEHTLERAVGRAGEGEGVGGDVGVGIGRDNHADGAREVRDLLDGWLR